MIIVFTGHRNKLCNAGHFAALSRQYPGAVWVCGGAVGFDSQVMEFAAQLQHACTVVPPDYQFGRAAPLIRNRAMVDTADLVIACHDGRATGGTTATMAYARKRGVPVTLWPALMLDTAPA
jgi:hypothetical protein